MTKHEKTWSLKEIDESRDAPKGTAFRAFKQLLEGFDEGSDFFYYSAHEDGDEIESLRATGRIYETTVNAVLFTKAGYEALAEYLDDD